MRIMEFVSSRVQRAAFSVLLTAGCMAITANAQTTVQDNGRGTNNGYFYSLYTSGGSSTMTLTDLYGGGNYSISWSGVNDMVGGKGWNPGGPMVVNYNVGAASGYNNISVYGWTTSPLVEYYICEFGSVANGNSIGAVTSDGHVYETYEHTQVNQPSILGTATFNQYLDNWGGSSIGQNHTVTTANHFNGWASHGLTLGTFNYMILGTESFGGQSGYVNATVW
jgi:endo-1,4-beta-xylanase